MGKSDNFVFSCPPASRWGGLDVSRGAAARSTLARDIPSGGRVCVAQKPKIFTPLYAQVKEQNTFPVPFVIETVLFTSNRSISASHEIDVA